MKLRLNTSSNHNLAVAEGEIYIQHVLPLVLKAGFKK